MAPKRGRSKRKAEPEKGSPPTPLALYKRGVAAVKSWSPLISDASDTEALTALAACARQLQTQMGLLAADGPGPAPESATHGSLPGSGSGSRTAQDGEREESGRVVSETATTAQGGTADGARAIAGVDGGPLAAVWPAVDVLEPGMRLYGAVVRHNLDLDLEDWRDEPGFLLASCHLELGKQLGCMWPRQGGRELRHLRAALDLFPDFVAGSVAMAKALLSRADSEDDLRTAERLLKHAIRVSDRLAAAGGDADGDGGGEGQEGDQADVARLPDQPGSSGPALSEVAPTGPHVTPEGRDAAHQSGGSSSDQNGGGAPKPSTPPPLPPPCTPKRCSSSSSLPLSPLLLDANAACRREWQTGAAARRSLAMLLCQQGRDGEAAPLLAALDFTHRLARPVLHYPLTAPPGAPSPTGHERYVRAVDGALPYSLLRVLRDALGPDGRFWREHGYGRVGYFSYMHELSSPGLSAIHQAASLVHRLAVARFPVAAEARYAEWWAHCRAHPSGHQLHFDSDDEGAGGVRNPIVSGVIYLTGGIGGPTLVTPQLLGGPLAPHGWIVHPAENRLGMFDSTVLHGVIPGRGASPKPGQHRITLMIAFWKDIQCRPRADGLPGPSQPFPNPVSTTNGRYTWTADLPPHPDGPEGWGSADPRDAEPISIERVWERIDGAAAQPGAVQYDACFQGF